MTKARINNARWRDHPTICLGISIGKPVFEGASLHALLDCAAHTGKPTVIRVSDTLQRHNIAAAGHDMRTATAMARARGDEWLKSYEPHIAQMPNIAAVQRWDEFLSQPDFERIHTGLIDLESRDAVFRDAIAADAHRFTEKAGQSGAQKLLYAAHSRAFLLEEAAGFILFARAWPRHIRLYPGRETESLRVLRQLAPHIAADMQGADFAGVQISNKTPQQSLAKKLG